MDHQTLTTFVWLIPAMPLISFFAIMLFTRGKNRVSHTIAIGLMLISFVLAQIVFWSVVGSGEELAANPIGLGSAIPWLPTNGLPITMGVMVDPLTAIMLFMVPLACLMIFIYSVGYGNFNKPRDSRDEPGKPPHHGVEPLYSRFFAFLSLFAAGMLTLVVADNLLMLFIGWEIMGLCSYLLIGFWYARNYSDPKKITPRGAAVKAFMTTRIGDVFMLLGIVFLYFSTGSLSFHDIFTAEKTHALATVLFLGIPAAQVIFGLLFIGTVGKSAQFPLHVWLPDAMEGPTPVSAMIHAAAMVSAGVYMVIRMFPLLAGTASEGAPTFGVMAAIGGFTALFAATIALAQNDIKKVLAYSTISQLGYMIAALGIGAWVAAAFHLITHAFFKALLFMGSGSVIHGVEHGQHEVHASHETSAHAEQFLGDVEAHTHAEHGHEEHVHEEVHVGPEFDPQDMFNMGGLRKKMPWTALTFIIGGLALSGFPFITAGFWSKDEILGEAYAHNPIIFWTLAVAALLTAFYTMRQISLSFLGKARSEAAEHAHESHWTMVLPLVILAFFAIFAGFAGTKGDFPIFGMIRPPFVHSSWFESFIEPTIAESGIHFEAVAFNVGPLVVSIIVAVGGLILGWLVYGRKPLAAGAPDPLEKLGGLWTLFKNKYYIDEIYAAVFVQPIKALAVWMGEVFDRGVIDGVLHGIGRGAVSVANAFRSFDTTVVNGGADGLADDVKRFGRWLREIQTGRVQNYLLLVLVSVVLLAALYITLFS
jgi:NADH-quinone oxidoreductase subunit L